MGNPILGSGVFGLGDRMASGIRNANTNHLVDLVGQSRGVGRSGRGCQALAGIGLVSALVAFVPPKPTDATTLTTTFQVTANIAVNCLITATPLAFGAYQPLAANATVPLDGQSEIQVACTNGGNFTIGLDQGTFPGATVTTRQMIGPGGVGLQYALFSDAARSVNWGNTLGVDTVAGVGAGSVEVISVFGQVAPGQASAVAGGYHDTITATLTF